LEDELETIIPGEDYEIVEEKAVAIDVETHDGMLEDLLDPEYEPRFAAKEDTAVEEESTPDMFEELHQELEETKENLTESDLFNLIDSMYDKKEDE